LFLSGSFGLVWFFIGTFACKKWIWAENICTCHVHENLQVFTGCVCVAQCL
jgi:hypothetical protein